MSATLAASAINALVAVTVLAAPNIATPSAFPSAVVIASLLSVISKSNGDVSRALMVAKLVAAKTALASATVRALGWSKLSLRE